MKDNRADELTYNDKWRMDNPVAAQAADVCKKEMLKRGMEALPKLEDWKLMTIAGMIESHITHIGGNRVHICNLIDVIMLTLECRTEDDVSKMTDDQIKKSEERFNEKMKQHFGL